MTRKSTDRVGSHAGKEGPVRWWRLSRHLKDVWGQRSQGCAHEVEQTARARPGRGTSLGGSHGAGRGDTASGPKAPVRTFHSDSSHPAECHPGRGGSAEGRGGGGGELGEMGNGIHQDSAMDSARVCCTHPGGKDRQACVGRSELEIQNVDLMEPADFKRAIHRFEEQTVHLNPL